MEIHIWSDVRCPFCYVGKRKFEKSIENFEHKDKIKVHWHSFELDPNIKTEPGVNSIDHLALSKGISRANAEQMMGHVVKTAEDTDLVFNFDKSVVANSFNAHRLIQFAQSKGFGNQIEEAMFKAHFTDGTNIDDKQELLKIAENIGLDKKETQSVLDSDQFSDVVREDEINAQKLGIRGVPFFVFNNKYAVSGAQPVDVFDEVLETSWKEFNQSDSPFIVSEGQSCDVDGNCD